VVVDAPDFGPALDGVVVGVAGADAVLVLPVVGVTGDDAAVVLEVVWGSIVELVVVDTPGQMVAYDGATVGAGSLEEAGSSIWNLRPSTSPGKTDCSVGPLLA
jgi:hypothetical protein